MRNGRKRSRDDMLEYRLTDLLEIKYSSNPNEIKSVRSKLLSRPIQSGDWHCLDALVLGNALVVIQAKVSRRLRELFLLNPAKQTFRILPLEEEKYLRERKNRNGKELS